MENATKIGISVEKTSKSLDHRISIAPMMDWTDRHCRYFLRGFSAHALLYTEMITAAAILRGDRTRLLAFDPEEHPIALQLGGSNPSELADAAQYGEQAGFDEINLNCGCPSDRVVGGAFGACLMRSPQRVAECVAAMKLRVRVPVTVKMRIGIVDGHGENAKSEVAEFNDADFARLVEFVTGIRDVGCDVAIVHARKAVLGGLSPKENREVPPLRYDIVSALKAQFPELPIVVNGGFRAAPAIIEALNWCDGVMLGREAYHRPSILAEVERALYPEGAPRPAPREAILERMAQYAEREVAGGERLHAITRHMLGLHSGEPGAREYRRLLSEGVRMPGAGPHLIREAKEVCKQRFPSSQT